MRITYMPALLGAAVVSACSGMSNIMDPATPGDVPTVLAIAPANAAQTVDPAQPVVIAFSRPMMAGMESLVVLHEGTVTGLVVVGIPKWSVDRTMLTFRPLASLRPHTTYVLHLSPGLEGQNGRAVNLGPCAQLGGQWVAGGMVGASPTGGMMNGGWGPGMMGSGWRAADGTFGMFFTFTTA